MCKTGFTDDGKCVVLSAVNLIFASQFIGEVSSPSYLIAINMYCEFQSFRMKPNLPFFDKGEGERGRVI